ncbi:MAG: hypothetical protein CME64_15655 [Halobacteriovoraceae bacterium]|nr:hypothetical protein [Halobacteriovoraceae bacterium]|tara:strand:+ start:181260 stop:181442 length:183 start_codon:yes stop_codon:yes gene_type:complete
MKNLFYTLLATALFTTSALAAGVDHVDTNGAICGDRSAGKAVATGEVEEVISEGASATGN